MIHVFSQSLRAHRIGLGAVSLGLFSISLIIVYTFEAFGGLEAFADLYEQLPESMQALFRAQGGFAANAEGYLAADYRHPLYLIAMSAFIIAAAAGAVAGEVERGSVLILLSAPIARWRYLLAKMDAILVGILVLTIASAAGTWLGVIVTSLEDVDMTVFLRVQVNTFALAFAIAGIALLVSSALSDGGQATGITAGVIVTMYFVDFLSLLWGPAEPLGPLSLFHYYDPLKVSQESGLPLRDLAVLVTAGLAGVGAALAVFQRRDIAR